MSRVVIALYENNDKVREAIQDLVEAGFDGNAISMVAYDPQRAYGKMLWRQALGEESASSENVHNLSEGTGLGALIGSVGGFFAGLLAMALPGIGPVVAAGPLITTLAGAGIGATAGIILGALVETGLPADHARMFTEGIRRGDTLLMVNTSDDRAREAVELLNQHEPIDLDSRLPLASKNGHIRVEQAVLKDNLHGSDLVETVFNPGQFRAVFAELEPRFHEHYTHAYLGSGKHYSDFKPAYLLGCELATNERYQKVGWGELEPKARQSWERRYQDLPWEEFKEAVHQAWEITKSRR